MEVCGAQMQQAAVAMAAMAAAMAVAMAAPPATFLHACEAIRRAVSVCSMGRACRCRQVRASESTPIVA